MNDLVMFKVEAGIRRYTDQTGSSLYFDYRKTYRGKYSIIKEKEAR
ncbi:MAG: hypothetical protein M0R38_12005 [Bacteroidia bacterium]|nr:hypothetical protein [Bacteroidia bacterium]